MTLFVEGSVVGRPVIMSIVSRLTHKFKHMASIGLAFGVFAIAIAGVSIIANHTLPASAASNSCDKVNVLYCGLDSSNINVQIAYLESDYILNTSEHPTPYHDVKTIYNYVGATPYLIATMNPTNTVAATIYRNGNVTVKGKVIATNARSVGRFYVPGSIKIPGTTNAYIRYTTSSFANDSLPAIVRLDSNGNMLFGAMITCGNAFTATPVPKVTPPPPAPAPNYTIKKEVAVKGSTSFYPSITVNSGTHVVYRITVSSTGAIPVTSVAVNDVLPSGISYVVGTVAHDGIGTGTTLFEDVSVSDGYRIASLNVGSSVVLTFEATVGPNDTATSCTPETINNTVTMTQKVQQYGVDLLSPRSSTATVYKTCTAPPVVQTTVIYVPSTTVVVAQVPVSASCTNLTLSQSSLNPRIVTATVTYNASSGVMLNNVSFNWNDGSVTNNGIATSAQHTYLSDGTFNVLATLSFSYGSTNMSPSTCQVPISFGTTPPPPSTPQVVVNQVVTQTVNQNQVVSPVVAPTLPDKPTTLVNTGPGSVAGLFAGVSTIGTVGYRFFLSRRFGRY